MTGEAKVIGAYVKLACTHLLSVKKLSASDRNAPTLMLYAAENLLLSIFTSEGIDGGAVRRKVGNHQLDRMLDELPDDCPLKVEFDAVVNLVAYATTYRYPTATGNLPAPPPAEEAEAYFASLRKILETCTKHFQVDVRLDQPIAGNTRPFR